MDNTMTRHQGGTPLGADQKPVNLALQGGGAHGAFAWGVLDKLLEDGRLTIDAMSATSAGAMNAVVAAYGLSIGGPDGAREKLDDFGGTFRVPASSTVLSVRFYGRHGRRVAGATWTFRRHSSSFRP
jgi:predicted acylesterase/phospholipase RssA